MPPRSRSMPSVTAKPMPRRLFAIERASLEGLGSAFTCRYAPLPMTSATRRPVMAAPAAEAGVDAAVCVGADGDDGAVRGCAASDNSDSLTFAVAWLALLPASEATPSSVEL